MAENMKREAERQTVTHRNKELARHWGSFVITGILLMMLVVVLVSSINLRQSNEKKQARLQELEKEYAELEQEALEIEEYEKYIQTPKFKEEWAKSHFNYVYDNEILLKGYE